MISSRVLDRCAALNLIATDLPSNLIQPLADRSRSRLATPLDTREAFVAGIPCLGRDQVSAVTRRVTEGAYGLKEKMKGLPEDRERVPAV